ncbi:MAG: glycosyltransferase family 2 protein [Gemmatimonadales bacterium]
MSRTPHPVVILTPVRNEAWILDRFLAIAAACADHVILADQGSTDGSREIAARYPMVTMVANEGDGYDEAGRQRLLLETARRIVPGPKVLLALDADELIAADGPSRPSWQTMRTAAPGTVVCFERVDLYLGTERCLRHDDWRPLGYVDDGAAHEGRAIHSGRVPLPAGAPRLKLNDVRILHYAALRTAAFAAKLRFYSVTENVLGTCRPPLKRRLRYLNHLDLALGGRLEASRREWFAGWEEAGLDMATVDDPEFSWYDAEVLRAFGRYGTRRFWLDDLWRFDWEAARQWAIAAGYEGMPERPVRPCPDWLVWLMRVVAVAHRRQVLVRQRLSGRRSRRFE